MARVTAFQAVGRGFESRLPLKKQEVSFSSLIITKDNLSLTKIKLLLKADVAQLVEHILGKDEVTGSIPVVSSNLGKNYERYYHTRMY